MAAAADSDEESVDLTHTTALFATFVEQTPELHIAAYALRPKLKAPLDFEALSRVCTSFSPYDQDEIAVAANAIRFELTDETAIDALELLQRELFPPVPISAGGLILPTTPNVADKLADQYGWTALFNANAIPKADTANYKRIYDVNGTNLRSYLLERENRLGKYGPNFVKTMNVITPVGRNPPTDMSVASLSGTTIPDEALICRAHGRGALPISERKTTDTSTTKPVSRQLFDEESALEDGDDLSELESHVESLKKKKKKPKGKPGKPSSLETIMEVEKARTKTAAAAPQQQQQQQQPEADQAAATTSSFTNPLTLIKNTTTLLKNTTVGLYNLGASIVGGTINILLKAAKDDIRAAFTVKFVKDGRTVCVVEILPAPRALQSIGNSIYGYLTESIDPHTGIMKRLNVDVDKIPEMEATLEHSVTLNSFNDPSTGKPGLKVDLKEPFFARLKEMWLHQDLWAINVWSMIKYGEEDLRRSWVAVVVEDAEAEPLTDLDLIYYRIMAASHIRAFLELNKSKERLGRVYFFPYAIRLGDFATSLRSAAAYVVTEDPKKKIWSTSAETLPYRYFWPYVPKGSKNPSYRERKKPDAIYMVLTGRDENSEQMLVCYNNGIPLFDDGSNVLHPNPGKKGGEDEGDDAGDVVKEKTISDALAAFFDVGKEPPSSKKESRSHGRTPTPKK